MLKTKICIYITNKTLYIYIHMHIHLFFKYILKFWKLIIYTNIYIYYVYTNQVHIFWQQMKIYTTWKQIQQWIIQPKCHYGFLMVWPHQLDFKCMETFSGCFFHGILEKHIEKYAMHVLLGALTKGGFTPGRHFYHCSCLKTQAWLLGVKALDKRASPL